MKVFRVYRVNDESGVSGRGFVIYGVVFDDGVTVIRWASDTASTAIYKSYEDFYNIHIEPHPKNQSAIATQVIEWEFTEAIIKGIIRKKQIWSVKNGDI